MIQSITIIGSKNRNGFFHRLLDSPRLDIYEYTETCDISAGGGFYIPLSADVDDIAISGGLKNFKLPVMMTRRDSNIESFLTERDFSPCENGECLTYIVPDDVLLKIGNGNPHKSVFRWF